MKTEKVRQAASIAGRLISNDLAAPAIKGEAVLSQTVPLLGNEAAAVLGPLKVLLGGAGRIHRSFLAGLKDRKKLIPAVILAAVWIILIVLPMLGINPGPVKLLSFLTFAQGGISGNGFRIIGGILGKGVWAGFFLPLFSSPNPLNNIGGGWKQLISSFSGQGKTEAALLLLGAGGALICYNFMAGSATLGMSMAGIAGFAVSLRALGSRTGFLRSLTGSLIAKIKRESKIDTTAVNRAIAGISAGFVLSVPLSATGIGMIGYLSGFIFLVIAAALSAAGKKDKGVAA